MKSPENSFISPDDSFEEAVEKQPEFELSELSISDVDSIKDLEDRSWIPDLQTDKETIEKRLNLGHKIIGIRYGEQLVGKVCFGYSNFSPDLSPQEQRFPETFKDFSSIPQPEKYNSCFIYNLDIDPQFRGDLALIEKLINTAKEKAIADGCQYGVLDVRIPSYNGSSGHKQESRPMNESIHQTLDSYTASEENILPIRDNDLKTLSQEPILHLYSQLTGCKPLWIAKDFIPEDKPSGRFRIISYIEAEKPKISLSKEWMLISELSYGTEFINELSEFLQEKNIKTILECCSGSGSILKGLAEKGFDCVGIDSDIEMIARAVKENPTSAHFELSDLLDLDESNDQFDAVMCRGNSLSVLTSWGKDGIDPEKAHKAIIESLQTMLDRVKDDGLLYLDTLTQNEINRGSSPVSFEAENVSLGGFVEYDPNKRTRHMYGSGVINNQPFEGESYSYIITPSEIVDALKQLGVKNAWLEELNNEKNYQIICAKK
ncbi:class I SAM-dependent methyltransferase [Patescibacteria group bacterium]|nr:class I SAM-dependent methyltransferase [Patescibacteria group bacterium]